MEALVSFATEHAGATAALLIVASMVGYAAWMISRRVATFEARLVAIEQQLARHAMKDDVLFQKLDELVQKVSRIEGILERQG